MKCPVCNVDLLMSERQGIEIDYCSKCRGVWLDRGELDKIIEGSGKQEYSSSSSHNRSNNSSDSYQGDRNYSNNYQYPKKKKESFLSEIFDVF
jgi:uncharacterized protein